MFEYTLTFRKTDAHDALSRLPLPGEPAMSSLPPELVLLTEHLSNSPQQIRDQTRKDPDLALVLQFKVGLMLILIWTSFPERKMELSKVVYFEDHVW